VGANLAEGGPELVPKSSYTVRYATKTENSCRVM